MMIQNANPKMNPKCKLDCPKTFQVTYWHAHQPNYYLNLHVTLYFVKYNNSIPFSKEQLCQANKSFVDCCNQFIHFSSRPHVHFGTNFEVLIRHFIEK